MANMFDFLDDEEKKNKQANIITPAKSNSGNMFDFLDQPKQSAQPLPLERRFKQPNTAPIPSASSFKMLPSHVVPQAPQPTNYGAAWARGTLGSLVGRAITPLAEKVTGRKIDLSTLPESNTFGEKALGMVGNLGADLPLWLAGDAALAKPLSILAKTAPVAKGIGQLGRLAPALGTGVRAAATFGGPINALDTAVSGDGLQGFKDRLKEAPLMGLGGSVLHGGGQLLGKGLKEGIDFKRFNQATKLPDLKSNPLKDLQTQYRNPVSLRTAQAQQFNKTFSDTPNLMEGVKLKPLQQGIDESVGVRKPLDAQSLAKRELDTQSAFGGPREIKKSSFTTGEQRAFQELQDGITEAQNYVRHTDILAPYPPGTTIEAAYADVKANTGVDIPKLMSNWEKTQKLKGPLTQSERLMGRKAGVIPPLKQREGFPLQQNLESQLPKRPIEKPAPLQWTNKDGMSAGPLPIRSINEGNLGQLPRRTQPELSPSVESPRLASPSDPLQQTTEPSRLDYTKIKDITGFEGSSKDMYRILEQKLGKESADHIMDPFTQSKGSYIDLQSNLANEMKSVVVDGLGIKKGSKESELVQKFGEKEISLEELKSLAPDKWRNIVEADKWFREKYNSLIDQINASKREIYPNAEKNVANIEQKIANMKMDATLTVAERQDALKNLQQRLDDAMRNKVVPKRDDYYRHFQEMSQGVSGLKNIFENPTMIDPRLVGRTADTRPRSKWASIAQKRLGNKTQYDAVGGFLDYLPQASYAIHIDPHIPKFRALSDEIANATIDTKNANNLINTLQNYANDLSGKTNPADRYMMENVPGGRTTVAALGWLQNRIKSNVILGNLGSAVSQVANIPNGIAFAKQHSAEGLARTVKTLVKPSEEMLNSPFLKERYGGPGSSIYQQFDTSLLNKPKKFAIWVLNTADKIGSEFIWNSAYAKGKAEGVSNLVKYADDATRKLVAGRGIGEVPLMYKSKIFGLIAPFQLEVGNLWHIQKDMVSSKDFGGIATLYLSMYLFNRASEKVKGYGVTFDPIQSIVDASQSGLTPVQRGGRLAGEVFSNLPFGQNIAKLAFPEYGGSVSLPGSDNSFTMPSRKELFGKNDPTRYGSGNLIADTLTSPEKAVQNLVMPFGGSQIVKTLKGVNALKKGGVYNADGSKLSYPVTNNLPNMIKGPLFGTSGLSDAKTYYDLNRRPLSEDQTKKIDSSSNRLKSYEDLMNKRKADALKEALRKAKEDSRKANSKK